MSVLGSVLVDKLRAGKYMCFGAPMSVLPCVLLGVS